MAQMISMNNNFFLTGIVEDVNDPIQLGRVRVRWIGIHTDNKSKMPTDGLPWCQVLGSINSAGISGVGLAPVGVVAGTMVFGLPLDDGMQEFIILGTLAGNRSIHINPSMGFNDPKGEYPRAGVVGDINKRAGGNGDTGSSFNVDAVVIKSDIPGAKDPTVPEKKLDPKAYDNTPWMPFAQGEVGKNEADNPDRIKEYHQTGGGQMLEPTVAWCASFIGWCLGKADIKGTRSAASRSYLRYGKSVGKDNVPFGSIAVFGVPNSGQGHVAFVLEDKGDKLVCIGGNQSDKDHRSGGIVSRTTIPKSGSKLVLLDCVYPTNLNGKG
jgi:uncharacterized protein (TIGR02594 family)